jgi:hypothetical protein
MSNQSGRIFLVSCLALIVASAVFAADATTKLPLFFAPGPNGDFTAFGSGYRMVLRGTGGEVRFPGGAGGPMRWEFEHANQHAKPRGAAVQGVINNIRGKDPRRWRTGISAFGAVGIDALYPGVDLLYHGREGEIEYDLHVAPGADPSVVQMGIHGARDLSIDAEGALLMCIEGGCLRQRAPVAYQENRRERRRVPVAFDLDGNEVRLRLGSYDSSRELVIDPVLDYSTCIGGSQFEGASGVAVDAAGNIFVTGQTQSPDFPLVNASDNTFSGFSEAFVVKLNAAGQLVYATFLGGSGSDTPTGIAVDSVGNAYVLGETTSADFPIVGGFDSTLASFRDAYIAVLSPTGVLLHSTYLGGSDEEIARGIAVDTGRVLVTGQTNSADFPITPTAIDPTYKGTGDAFITVLHSSLSTVIYSTFFGGSGNDNAAAIAADAFGNIVVAGLTSSNNFPTLNAIDGTLHGTQDAFVVKLSPAGSLLFSTYLGGGALDAATGVATDTAGAVYVTGYTESADFPVTAGSFDTTYNGNRDAFVTKLNPAGTLAYSTFLGGAFLDSANAIAVNASGNAFVTGLTAGFPLVNPIDSSLGFLDAADAFVAELTATGDTLLFSTYLGGSDVDSGNAISVTGEIIYVAGTTLSSNFPVTPNGFDHGLGGTTDAFVARIFVAPSTTTTTLSATPRPVIFGQPVTLTAAVTGGPTTATGTISFQDGVTVLAVVPVSNGTATFMTTSLPVGANDLVAVYGGDATHTSSTSNTVHETVLPLAAIPTLADPALLLLAITLSTVAFHTMRGR